MGEPVLIISIFVRCASDFCGALRTFSKPKSPNALESQPSAPVSVQQPRIKTARHKRRDCARIYLLFRGWPLWNVGSLRPSDDLGQIFARSIDLIPIEPKQPLTSR